MIDSTTLFDIIKATESDIKQILEVHSNIECLNISDTKHIYIHLLNINEKFKKYINIMFLNSNIEIKDLIIHNLILLILDIYIHTNDLTNNIKNSKNQAEFINKWNLDIILTKTENKTMVSEKKMIEYFLKYDYNISYLTLSLNAFIDKMSRLENLNINLRDMKVS